MLANGSKLGYRESDEGQYEDLPGLKEIPEMGTDGEKVENTALTDKQKKYEMGIGDAGDITYKFKYDNKNAGAIYRKLRGMQTSGKAYQWQETLMDGTTTEFEGPCSIKRTGGGVNGVVEINLTIYLQSELKITDPT